MSWVIEYEPSRKIYIYKHDGSVKVAVLMHGTAIRQWADELAEELVKKGWNVLKLNGGVEEECQFADELEEILQKFLEKVGAW